MTSAEVAIICPDEYGRKGRDSTLSSIFSYIDSLSPSLLTPSPVCPFFLGGELEDFVGFCHGNTAGDPCFLSCPGPLKVF